jgi:hypothetical protein
MSLGTVLTLFVVPAAYLLVNNYIVRAKVAPPAADDAVVTQA